jgi:hypothetical protein
MFNTYRGGDYTKVEIKQQPNDAADAARLFGEVKKEAEREIAKAVRIDSNSFNCVVHVYKDAMSGLISLKAFYDLNGRKLTTTIDFDLYDKPEVGIVKLYEAISKDITSQILQTGLLPVLNQRLLNVI